MWALALSSSGEDVHACRAAGKKTTASSELDLYLPTVLKLSWIDRRSPCSPLIAITFPLPHFYPYLRPTCDVRRDGSKTVGQNAWHKQQDETKNRLKALSEYYVPATRSKNETILKKKIATLRGIAECATSKPHDKWLREKRENEGGDDAVGLGSVGTSTTLPPNESCLDAVSSEACNWIGRL